MTIEWFSCVGQDSDLDLQLKYSHVLSWKDAGVACAKSKWENITLEERNDLSWAVRQHEHPQQLSWNEIVDLGKDFTQRNVCEQVNCLMTFHSLPNDFKASVEWDMTLIYVYLHYKNLGVQSLPIFYGELYKVYTAGHFPCGWVGSRKDGHLLIY